MFSKPCLPSLLLALLRSSHSKTACCIQGCVTLRYLLAGVALTQFQELSAYFCMLISGTAISG
jgi:hypothetical protein